MVKRLPGGRRTRLLYRDGKRVVDKDWVLIYRSREIKEEVEGDRDAYIGIHAGKKFGNAVVRNRIKRQVREVIRSLSREDLPYDLIVIPRLPVKEKKYKEISRRLIGLLGRVRKGS